MLLKDLMTASPIHIAPETTLQAAAELMRTNDVGVLPVCVQDRIIGLLTDRDIVVRAIAEGHDPRQSPVRSIMTKELTTSRADVDSAEAERLMQERQIRRLAVVDEEDKLVGIVSLGDLATKSEERCGIARTLEVVSAERA